MYHLIKFEFEVNASLKVISCTIYRGSSCTVGSYASCTRAEVILHDERCVSCSMGRGTTCLHYVECCVFYGGSGTLLTLSFKALFYSVAHVEYEGETGTDCI